MPAETTYPLLADIDHDIQFGVSCEPVEITRESYSPSNFWFMFWNYVLLLSLIALLFTLISA